MNNNTHAVSQFRYIPSFDGLRGIAVVFVLLIHVSYGFFKGGWIGVDLFFVLSGYLITSLLQNEYYSTGKISFAKFYARRALRLFPPLLVCLALSNLLWPHIQNYPGSNQLLATLASLFYFANLIPGRLLGPLTHLWSLSVEEHFYLFWPVVVSLFLFRMALRKQIFFFAVLLLFVTAFRIYLSNTDSQITYGLFVIDAYRFSFTRIDAILMGSLLAVVMPGGQVDNRGRIFCNIFLGVGLCFLTIILMLLYKTNSYWQDGGFVLTNLLCLSMVAIAAKNADQPLLCNNAVRWLGRRSYGIYVYHYPIFHGLEVLRTQDNMVNLLLVTILRLTVVLIFAELSFRFIETPVLKYKNRHQVTGEFVAAPATRRCAAPSAWQARN